MRTTDPDARHRVEGLQQIGSLPAPDFEPEDMVAALTVAYCARKDLSRWRFGGHQSKLI
jgi:hypothetical protein